MWEAALKACAAQVDAELPRVLGDLQPASLRDAVRYYPDLGGKRLRPALAMLACEAAGGRREDALHAGIATELVHNFSLLHDDIMDQDATRRGHPSGHVKYGAPLAILAGDALFAKAFEVLHLAPAPAEAKVQMWHELAVASRVLCEGQQRDMELEQARDARPQDYYDMIYGKTGRLYECATRLGGLAARAGPAQVEALATYGRALGRGFQVRDDILDVAGDPKKRGKPWASDVRRGKRTIILLLARERAKGADAALLDRVVGHLDASDADVRRVVDLFQASGALDEAQRALQGFAPSEARGALEALARFSVEREH